MNTFPKPLTLARESGEPLVFNVGQIKLKDYPRALRAVNAEDEFELCASACGTTAGAVQQLTPESFEQLLAAVVLANEQGFFSFARRRKNAATERAMITEMAREVISRQASGSGLTPPLPSSPPRPA